MNQKQLVDKFCFDYGWSPRDGELSHFNKFCDGIKSIDILRKTLDMRNHPKTETGRMFRPNTATLWSIAQDFINEKAAEKHRETMSNVSPGEHCFYCTYGHVIEIQERVGLWSTYVMGRCECSQGDGTGYLAQRRPVKPSKEIQDYAREHSMDCPWAADRIVHERNKDYRDEKELQYSHEHPIESVESGPGTISGPPDYDFGNGFEEEIPGIPF